MADDIIRTLRAYCVNNKAMSLCHKKKRSFEQSRHSFVYTGWRKMYFLFLSYHSYFPEITLLVLLHLSSSIYFIVFGAKLSCPNSYS